ncbi:MAG: hypothetical protein KatS3mg111_1166 [Pirellulaceae bacterium]|nr:MAG: hypothetical protein KatS3mg111_1166 [Pirellulaceae bacterium]
MHASTRIALLWVWILLTTWTALPARLPAQEAAEQTSLTLVSQDAGFYFSSLHLDRQWHELWNSRVVQRLRAVPYVQEVERIVVQQWESGQGQVGQAKAMLQNPNVRNAIQSVREMLGQEVFLIGGEDWPAALTAAVEFQYRLNNAMAEGPDAVAAFWQQLTPEDTANIVIPTTIIGFRVQSTELFQTQLDALEAIVRLGLREVPEAQPVLQALRRTDFVNGQSLTLPLDLSMIPDEQLDEEARQALERARTLFAGRQVVVELGLKDDLFLIALSGQGGQIEAFGHALPTLIDHPAMAPIKEADYNALRSIGFVSADLREAYWDADVRSRIQQAISQFSLAASTQFDDQDDFEQWKEELQNDAQWLDEKLQELKPRFGPLVSWAERIDGGIQFFAHDGTEQGTLQNAAPLHILNHAGQSPVGLYALKSRTHPVVADLLDRLVERLPRHIIRFVRIAEDDPAARRQAIQAVRLSTPVIGELMDVFRHSIAPHLAPQETLLAFDTDWHVTQLGPNQPAMPRPMPLPELAVACGVSAPQGLLRGIDQLFHTLDKLVEVIRQVSPDTIPPAYQIPRPEREEGDGVVKLSYPQLASAIPVPGFSPQLTIASDVAILGYSNRQVRDMIREQELINRPGWLQGETPVAVVCFFDWSATISSIHPWIQMGLMIASEGELNEPLFPAGGPIPAPSANDVLQLWDCLTSLGKYAFTSTLRDDATLFTRGVWIEE